MEKFFQSKIFDKKNLRTLYIFALKVLSYITVFYLIYVSADALKFAVDHILFQDKKPIYADIIGYGSKTIIILSAILLLVMLISAIIWLFTVLNKDGDDDE